MPGPVARVHALSLGHATTLRARRACTHTYIAFRSQTRRLGALSTLRIFFTCRRAEAVLLHHAPAPLRSTNSDARATGSVGIFSGQPVRLQPDVARHARAPAPLGSRCEVSRERPTVLKQDATVVLSMVCVEFLHVHVEIPHTP